MNDEDVTKEIRGETVTASVSDYCAPAIVRTALVNQQRRIGKGNYLVCEGRDIGTVVFPDAELKIFMTASVAERAVRRQKDFKNNGIIKSSEELYDELEITISLKEVGIPKSALKELAFHTYKDAVNMATNPVAMTQKKVLSLIEELY